MIDNKEEPFLLREEISKEISKIIEIYKDLNFLEQFAIYMGKAQILEFGLKNLLREKYDYGFETMEKWTLGKVANELEKNNLRQDFIILLKSVVEYRNYIAHELLANQSMMKAMFSHIFPENHYDKDSRRLHKAIYELEQTMFLFDWTQENNGWD